MPTYEYRCKDCGHEFEIQQSFSDDALSDCPTCEGALKKVYGNVGIAFKGSGFYKNDARPNGSSSSSSTTSTTTSTDSSSSSSDSSTTKSDTKKAESSTPAASTSSAATKTTTSSD